MQIDPRSEHSMHGWVVLISGLIFVCWVHIPCLDQERLASLRTLAESMEVTKNVQKESN